MPRPHQDVYWPGWLDDRDSTELSQRVTTAIRKLLSILANEELSRLLLKGNVMRPAFLPECDYKLDSSVLMTLPQLLIRANGVDKCIGPLRGELLYLL